MSRTQLYGMGIVLIIVLAVYLVLRVVSVRRKLRRHQAACRRPDYEPRDTFTGTLRHLSGLPVPRGRKLGTAVNAAWGLAFAKNRFRYAVPITEIEAVRMFRSAERFRIRWPLWPQQIVEIVLNEREPLLFSLPWPGRFGQRLLQAVAGEEPGNARAFRSSRGV